MRNPLSLVRTVRELRARSERQHKRIARLETEVGALQPRLAELERRLEQLDPGHTPPSAG